MNSNTDTTLNPLSEVEQLRARLLELETQHAKDTRTFEERVIEHAAALVKERDERLAIVEEENAKAIQKQVLRRPTNWNQWQSLTVSEKAQCVALYGEGIVVEVLKNKSQEDARIRQEEQARRLAASKPLFQR